MVGMMGVVVQVNDLLVKFMMAKLRVGTLKEQTLLPALRKERFCKSLATFFPTEGHNAKLALTFAR